MRRRKLVAAGLALALVFPGLISCSPVPVQPLEQEGMTEEERIEARRRAEEAERAANEESIRQGLTVELDLMVAPDAEEAARIAARLDEAALTSLATYGTDTAELLSHLLARFSYEIHQVEVVDDTAVCRLTVANVDLASALEAAHQSMMEGEGAERLAAAYQTGSEEEIMRAATEVVFAAIDAAPVNEHELDLSLTREGDTWQLSAESQAALISSALGGEVSVPVQ